MRRRLIALGIISPLFLALCAFAFVTLGIVSWIIFTPETAAPVSKRIATLAPLSLPDGNITPDAAANGPLPPPAENQTTPSSPENAAEPEAGGSQPAEALAAPSPTPDIEAALGFALPPDTVNSVTRQGIATRLVIPTLNLDAPVTLSSIKNQTWDVAQLGQAVGHLEGTAPPGSNSNLVLAGHVTLAAGVYGPFAGLAQLSKGDLIVVYEGSQKYQYVVDGYRTVERTDVQVTHPTDTGQITLITCTNWNREAGQYDQRIIVQGHLLEE